MIPVSIDWLLRSDYKWIRIFERDLGDDAWTAEDFNVAFKSDLVGLCARIKTYPVGYIIYTIEPSRLTITRIHVDNTYKREKIGTQLINRLIDKAATFPRPRYLRFDVPEDRLDIHLFLRSLKFRATVVLPRSQKYRFAYPIQSPALVHTHE